jgi:CheY-like chemotaxis protein
MATILYVEDNEDNMFIVHRRLTLAGFDVVIARNGAEGITMAADVKPDLIVMDLVLPVLDGLEATRRLKARPDRRLRRVRGEAGQLPGPGREDPGGAGQPREALTGRKSRARALPAPFLNALGTRRLGERLAVTPR